jgi:hypothetical protein
LVKRTIGEVIPALKANLTNVRHFSDLNNLIAGCSALKIFSGFKKEGK